MTPSVESPCLLPVAVVAPLARPAIVHALNYRRAIEVHDLDVRDPGRAVRADDPGLGFAGREELQQIAARASLSVSLAMSLLH